jgi:hypothetical protein
VHPKLIVIFLAGLAGVGCSADWYRYSADRQVQRIVREREQQTLAYTPQVEAATTVQQNPAATAYAKVPLTPRAPPATAPIEPSPDVAIPYESLGPKQLLPSGASTMEDTEAARLLEGGRASLQLGPPVPGNLNLHLDLFTSIGYAVQHSREYQSQMEDLYLAALGVTLQRHLFEPRPFAQTGLQFTGGQENVNYRSALEVTNTVGVRQRLPYGGDVTARALVNFVNAINGNVADSEPASLALSASVPLLRGAGLVNLEPLINSERQMVYQVREFESFRREFAVSVATQYFRLLTEQQAIVNRRQNLASLVALTERTNALYIAGRLNYIDVQRALQEQLRAQNDLVDAEANYQSALDTYKLLLGAPVDQPITVVSRELDVDVPQIAPDDAVQLAHRFRLDIRTAADRIEDAQRGVQVAKNGLLPGLDLTASGQVGNTSGASATHLNNNTSTYSAGVVLDLPIDRLAERNQYRVSLIELERAQRAYDRLKDQVAADARDALRTIRSAQQTLVIQAQGIELAKLRLENANELLRQGKRDSRDVTEAQRSLLEAQDAYERAKNNLQIQVLQFLRDTGTLRVDPDAGSLGRASDRKGQLSSNARPINGIVETEYQAKDIAITAPDGAADRARTP